MNGRRPAPPPQDANQHAASAERITQWAAAAAPGDRATYFTGHFLPLRHPAVDAARALHARGEVLFTQSRRADGRFDYHVTKRKNAEAGCLSAAAFQSNRAAGGKLGVHGGATGANREPSMAEELDSLMAVLRRLANFAKPCPTNAALADMAYLKDAESARYRLGLLQQAGRIDIRRLADDRRVVTIVSSGRSTAR